MRRQNYRTYWVVEYVQNFKGTFPKSWNGSTIEKQSSLNKDSLVEYALIILENDKKLDNAGDYDNEKFKEHIQVLANKKQTKDNAQLNGQVAQTNQVKKRQRKEVDEGNAQRNKGKKRQKRQRKEEKDDNQNSSLHTVVCTSRPG